MRDSTGEAEFKRIAQATGLSKTYEMTQEYRFVAHHVGLGDGVRSRIKAEGLHDWRFDFAFVDMKVAVEIEGGNWSQGRHTRGQGFEQDCEKYNAAALLGWTIIRFTPTMLRRLGANAAKIVLQAIENRADDLTTVVSLGKDCEELARLADEVVQRTKEEA